ncbi:MAG TPA: hypothetical protein VJ812_03545 [Gemmatimonadaceae bacterium]|nr:hypothetical protein [Gemmatimonadaceae bacterium]
MAAPLLARRALGTVHTSTSVRNYANHRIEWDAANDDIGPTFNQRWTMRVHFRGIVSVGTLVPLVALLCGCDRNGITEPDPSGARPRSAEEAPAPALVTITIEGDQLPLWPYTGVNFSGAPQDPINLVFIGQASPLQIRAALRQLDGNRTAFGLPGVFPFNCTWSDAIGDVQTSYADPEQWTGSAVQLECGSYGPIRFHMRLFRQGSTTIANVHFEVLIAGTATHQVLSWELAEQLATVDLVRTGLLGAAPAQTGALNQAPTFREIPAAIYNGLPQQLRAVFGGPLADVTAPVGIATNGSATVFSLARAVPVVDDQDIEDFVVTFNQVIPKPFCSSGPNDFLLAQGPLHLRQEARVSGGSYSSFFTASGTLSLTPFDPVNRTPVGDAYTAEVYEEHEGSLSSGDVKSRSVKLQKELPNTGPFRGTFHERLKAGNPSADQYDLDIDC